MRPRRSIDFIPARYRIPATMLLGLVLGLGGGTWFAWTHDRFLVFYTGGAVGIFVGFWSGLAWLLTHRGGERPFAMIVILGLAAHLLAYSAYLNLAWRMGDSAVLHELQTLDTARLSKIFILRHFRSDPLAIIEKRLAIQEFVRACRTVRPYVPMPDYEPRIIFSCYVDLGDAFSHVLYVHYFHDEDDVVVGLFVRRQGDTEIYRGTFVSQELRKWFDTYLDPL